MTFDSEYEPFFQPPGWIIGPIWGVLYTCLLFSIIHATSKKQELDNFNLIVISFMTQLILNLLWPSVFNAERYFGSLIMIILMVLLTGIYAFLTYRNASYASILVWPYIAWVTFAGAINIAYYLDSR